MTQIRPLGTGLDWEPVLQRDMTRLDGSEGMNSAVLHTFVPGLEKDAVACCIITDINRTEGSLSSSSAQHARVLSLWTRSM